MAVRVLVVDDAAFMRMMVKDILSKNGYEVVGEAENGMKALERYQELKPDLVTMDITMPEMDGISAVKEIKKVDPNAKIVMCSAMGQQAMVIEAIQAGARDFIVKPFQADRVLEQLALALEVGAAEHRLHFRTGLEEPLVERGEEVRGVEAPLVAGLGSDGGRSAHGAGLGKRG